MVVVLLRLYNRCGRTKKKKKKKKTEEIDDSYSCEKFDITTLIDIRTFMSKFMSVLLLNKLALKVNAVNKIRREWSRGIFLRFKNIE